jgi:hypothetical protein
LPPAHSPTFPGLLKRTKTIIEDEKDDNWI